MWVNLKLQLAWNVCVFKETNPHAKWETLQIWSLHAKMGTAHKQGSKPDSSSTRPRVSLSLLLTCFSTLWEKKTVQESLTQFQLKGQRTSTGMRACRPAVRSFLEDSCILEKHLDSTSWFSEKCSDHQFIS